MTVRRGPAANERSADPRARAANTLTLDDLHPKALAAPNLLAFAAVYLAGASLSKLFGLDSGQTATFWLPSGIYLGWLLLTRRSHWPWLVIAALLADVLAAATLDDVHPAVALAGAAANTFEALLGAFLLRAICGTPFHLHSPRNVFALVGVGAVIAPALGATLGAATLHAARLETFGGAWPVWYMGDGLGVLIAAPVLISLRAGGADLYRELKRRWLEALAMLLTFAGVIHVVFSYGLPLVLLVVHPLLWAALRFGVAGTTLTTAMLALQTLRYVADGATPFPASPLAIASASVFASLYLDVISVAGLILASAVEQRVQMMRALRRSHAELEEQVAARTAALRESQSLMAAAYRLNPFPMALQSLPDGRFLEVNDACVRASGFTREDMQGVTSIELGMHLDPAARGWILDQAKEHGHVRDCEVKLRAKTGDVRDYSLHADVIVLNGKEHLLGTWVDITDRKRAEQAWRDSEERLQLALDAAEQGVWSLQTDTGQFQSDARGWALHGFARASSTGSWEEVRSHVHPEDLAVIEARFEASRKSNAAFEAEYRIVVPHGKPGPGETRWLSTAARWDTQRTQLLGVVRDVTAGRQAAEALYESEMRLRELFEQSTTGISRTDLTGRFIAVNPRFCAIVGRSSEELMRLSVQDVTHPEDLSRCAAAFEALVVHGTAFQIEKRYLRPDGAVAYVQNSVTRVMDAKRERAQCIVGFTMDITERKLAEAALRESERRAHRLIEANIIGVFTANEERVLEANDVFLRMVGRTREELEAGLLDWRPLTPPEHLSSRAEALNQMADKGHCEAYEKEFQRSDGSRVPVLIGAAVIQTQPLTWVSFAADLTAQKQAQQQLQVADRRKDEFLALLSHELRNPLAPLRTAVHLLRKADDADPLLVQTRDMIARQVAHLARLVDDLLDVSRVTQRKIVLRRSTFSLRETVDAAIEMMRSALEAKSHTLALSLSDEPLFVEGDSTRLTQVFGNLLSNAAKFTPDGGRIEVSMGRRGDSAVVTVRDDGEGIEPALLPHVFDLFMQGDPSLARSQGGLGIGLSLVRSLVAMHGGSVTAHSAGSGYGSEFIVRLPASAARSATYVMPSPERPASAACHRVLVVDDNRDAADSMATILAESGNTVERAYDGSAALDAAHRFHPDVVLLDIGLPEVDGYEVARRLRNDPPSDHLLLIAVTGYGTAEDRERSREVGFDHHLVKPVDVSAVSALIAGHHAGVPRQPTGLAPGLAARVQ